MPLYRYEAISEEGKKISNTIDADNLQDAKLKLFRRQIAAIKIRLISPKDVKISLKKTELLQFTRELARLLQAGLPLFESLSALEEKHKENKLHTLLLDMTDRIRSGQSFSKVLSNHPYAFDLLYISMIANAEKTGNLPQALEELSFLIGKQIQMKKQMITAFLYPGLLASFCLIVLFSLLFYVIPSLKELFEGRELHPFTKIVFACSHFACNAKFFLFSLFLMIGLGIIYLSSTKKGTDQMRSMISHLPWFKGVFAKMALVRFCRASSALLEGGVPAIQAFSQAKQVMKHPILEKVVALAELKISQGEPLHVSFEKHPLIPPLVPRMIAIAQRGGKLSFMMRQIAQIYEEELESLLTYFAAMAQPILLLILGGIVGFVLLSVLLPLTDVSSFVT